MLWRLTEGDAGKFLACLAAGKIGDAEASDVPRRNALRRSWMFWKKRVKPYFNWLTTLGEKV